MYPCYSMRTHPTLEKPDVQNLAACENEGKQWKPRMMKRKQQRMMKKDKKIDWNTSFNKRFDIRKRK